MQDKFQSLRQVICSRHLSAKCHIFLLLPNLIIDATEIRIRKNLLPQESKRLKNSDLRDIVIDQHIVRYVSVFLLSFPVLCLT